jgi:hypothetical protein
MQIQHVTELFSFEGEDFIREAYINLLGREVDEWGLRYYLGRLSLGDDKADIISQIARSSECCPLGSVKGFDALITEQQQRKHWFWGMWRRRSCSEKMCAGTVNALIYFGKKSLLEQRLLSQKLEELLITFENIARHSLSVDNAATSKQPRVRNLPDEVVCQTFREVLGRDPESDDVIAHHAEFPNVPALREALMDSEEFRRRMDSLSEHARVVLRRMLLSQSMRVGN